MTNRSRASEAPGEQAATVHLSTLDRFLPLWIGAAMALGIGLGRAFPDLNDQLERVKVDTVSLPIAIGLFAMMYPVLAKVRYRSIGTVVGDRRTLMTSLVLNCTDRPRPDGRGGAALSPATTQAHRSGRSEGGHRCGVIVGAVGAGHAVGTSERTEMTAHEGLGNGAGRVVATRVRHDHWIAGRAAAPAGGTYLPTIEPTTGGPGDEIAAGSAADVEAAVAAAAAAQRSWGRRTGAERSSALHRVADAIEAAVEELVALEQSSTGKIYSQARVEVDMAAAYFRYYAGVIRSHHGRTIDQGGTNHTYTRLEPYGVVAVITPWNFPTNQAARGSAPALAAGNAVVLKPSEFTSPATVRLAQIATEAGLPDGLLNVVTGTGPEVGSPLASHPSVRRVAFTGSVATGRVLAGIAAERLVPMTLELGGKSPLVVFADADLDKAVNAAVAVVSVNAGQVCSATTRLLVEESAHDEVVRRVVEKVAALEPGVDFGPIITEAQYRKVIDYFEIARAEGAEPLVGGAAYDRDEVGGGMYVQPTVYAGVEPHWRITREEIFGPVLVTMPFRDEAEALELANDTEYGLLASVWSGDVGRGLRMAEQIEAGQVAVNGGALTIETPLGGYKNSGYGREKGVEALHDYAQIKAISLTFG